MTKTRSSIRKIIEKYGSTITITPITITTDKWGDKTETDGTTVSTVGIPYDIMSERFNFQMPGDLVEGDMIMILKDDETVDSPTDNIRYKITFDSQDYDVISVEDYDVSDITLAKQVTCKKRIWPA